MVIIFWLCKLNYKDLMKILLLIILIGCFWGESYAQYVASTIQQRMLTDQTDVELDLIAMVNQNTVNYQEASADLSAKLNDIAGMVNDNEATEVTNDVPAIVTIWDLQTNQINQINQQKGL